jgi:hypothetical protein
MPRQHRAEPPAQSGRTALVASAVRYDAGSTGTTVYRSTMSWQTEAWRQYDICSELRYAANWVGNVLSRATLLAQRRTVHGFDTMLVGPSVDALQMLFGGTDGQTQMLQALGLHLTVAGEAFLVGRQVDGADKWEVVGVTELRYTGGNWLLSYGHGVKPIILDIATSVVIRIWRPHPNHQLEADSPVRALLPILTEIEYLTRHIFAQVTSRLAGAGVWPLPQSMQFPPPPENSAATNPAEAFMHTLAEAMLTPIKDPGSPAALVPITITVPDELLGKISAPIKFWSDLDQQAVVLRSEAIRRFAIGMDMPPEIVLGTATTGSAANHWTAWQIEESSIKVHVEPMLELIANALTVGYLEPLPGIPADESIGYDTAQLRLRPNRSREAIELFDRGELTAIALRRETGFDEDDAPNDQETKLWLLRKVASGSATPDQVAAALHMLGVDVPSDSPVPTRESRPAPSLDQHPSRALPPAPGAGPGQPTAAPPGGKVAPNSAALLAASEALVFRALERAGNRLRNATVTSVPKVSAADTYLYVQPHPRSIPKLLEDAWTNVPQILDGIADPVQVTASLDAYVRGLLAEQQPHCRSALAKHLCLLDEHEMEQA